MAKKAKQNILINQVNVRPVNRESLDIQKWRNAHKVAEGNSKNRKSLYEIYDDILLDEHLSSLVEKRANAITNLEIKFFDKNNKEVEELTPLINSTYFEEMLREVMNAKFYGFTLLELDWSTEEIYVNKTYTIDRRHVKPELGIVVANPMDNTGIDYLNHPFALFAGTNTSLGLLLKACALVIYKRNNIIDWSDFNEVFGKPYPQGKYTNEETRELLTEAFTKAGFDAFMVAPSDADIILHQGNTGTSNDNFKAFREAMNEGMSILILGQNLTTNVSGKGSYAAANVHNQVEDSIHIADREFVIKTLNEKLVPVLQRMGYAADGHFDFVYMDEMPLTERIAVDSQIAALVPVDDDYFYSTYSIPKPTGVVSSRVETVGQNNKAQDKEEEEGSKEELSLLGKIKGLFTKKKKALPFW